MDGGVLPGARHRQCLGFLGGLECNLTLPLLVVPAQHTSLALGGADFTSFWVDAGSRVASCGGASLHYFTGLLLVVGDTGLLDVCELLDGFDSGLLHSGLLHLGLLDGFDPGLLDGFNSGLLHSGHRIFVGLIL